MLNHVRKKVAFQRTSTNDKTSNDIISQNYVESNGDFITKPYEVDNSCKGFFTKKLDILI